MIYFVFKWMIFKTYEANPQKNVKLFQNPERKSIIDAIPPFGLFIANFQLLPKCVGKLTL